VVSLARGEKNRNNLCFLLVHTVAPLALGGLIYLTWAPRSLKVFAWLKLLGLERLVLIWRQLAGGYRVYLPNWIFYYTPDFLWVYALTMLLSLLWLAEPGWRKFPVVTGLALGLALELGQKAGWISGTYDPTDLVAEFIAFLMAITIAGRFIKGSGTQ
jgi:hypothetical protein